MVKILKSIDLNAQFVWDNTVAGDLSYDSV